MRMCSQSVTLTLTYQIVRLFACPPTHRLADQCTSILTNMLTWHPHLHFGPSSCSFSGGVLQSASVPYCFRSTECAYEPQVSSMLIISCHQNQDYHHHGINMVAHSELQGQLLPTFTGRTFSLPVPEAGRTELARRKSQPAAPTVTLSPAPNRESAFAIDL
jgi:hypothetical protein